MFKELEKFSPGTVSGLSSLEQRVEGREAPDVNVCVKLLTHAFTVRFWRRISSGLENLVTRLSHSDARGPSHKGCTDSLSRSLDSQSSLFPIKRRAGLGAFFSFLEDLALFFLHILVFLNAQNGHFRSVLKMFRIARLARIAFV